MDKRRLANEITETVAYWLNYLEKDASIDIHTATLQELSTLDDGWINRYKREPLFRAQVDGLTAHLLTVVDRCERDTGDTFGCLRDK